MKDNARLTTVTHADGTVQEIRRRTVYGRTVPISLAGMTWNALIASAPKPTGGARHNPDHPSRKHDIARAEVSLTLSADVQGPVLGQSRRRDRRAVLRGAR